MPNTLRPLNGHGARQIQDTLGSCPRGHGSPNACLEVSWRYAREWPQHVWHGAAETCGKFRERPAGDLPGTSRNHLDDPTCFECAWRHHDDEVHYYSEDSGAPPRFPPIITEACLLNRLIISHGARHERKIAPARALSGMTAPSPATETM